MRLPLVATALVATLASCGNKSKLDADRGADVDALWDLAPDGAELGIVASPRAVSLALQAIQAARALATQPDIAPAKGQLDLLAKAMFGSDAATPEDAGFGAKPFAMFATADGVLGVMPVADRDKFMAAKHGKRGSNEDTLETNTCRELRGYYVCTTKPEMFERLGKGSLRGKTAIAGARGDAELFMAGVTFLGETKGDLAIAAQLDPGIADVHGRWTGTPSGVLEKVAGVIAPRPHTDGATGFVTFDSAPLLALVPSVPIAGGVTTDQLAASMVGPITATVPAGDIDIQVRIPLKDAKPATTIVDNCKDIGALFELANVQTPGACRIRLQGTNALELDVWVEGTDLRLGAKKGPMPAGHPGALTAVGRELANKDWTAALWGRGTMLNLSGITPTEQEVPDQVALGIHAMALLNELGAAARVDKDGVTFRAYMRTAFANPPDVVAKYVAVSGRDIVGGKATAVGTSIIATAPSSLFATDFAAGQGGLMIPAAAIGLATGVVIPAISRYINGDEAPEQHPDQPPMGETDLASLLVRAYIEEAYPKWKADHPNKQCPDKIDDLATYFGDAPGIPVMTDPWGNALHMECDKDGVRVFSAGPDGKPGTQDDIGSAT